MLHERTAHSNRIKGPLHGQGIRDAITLKPSFLPNLDMMRTGDGRALLPRLKDENLSRALAAPVGAEADQCTRRGERGRASATASGSVEAKTVHHARLRGIARKSRWCSPTTCSVVASRTAEGNLA
ncbi:hypothetical protein J2R76_003815 [Bradyrhizobium sp. USDA 4532]|uniref:hypothetical protein n=1 Tax=unclassified Bradyrhizobium TaxID=2631580 RepID=UPI0020A201CA|nr:MULTISPECIES: hypothetical protein [unclassified Bradyrhizobium]MCP1835478.1 hypothetical protein [Bradyrhizobium sp. USDA 4545]MCP1920224.1 hypothetical protein [Bradyrhizobium sp. USDA 4532]